MSYQKRAMFMLFGFAGLVILVGCPVRQPDLLSVDLSGGGQGPFCRMATPQPPYKLVITVKNLGNADAPSSITKVEFGYRGTNPTVITAETLPIAAGRSVDVVVDIPFGSPGCARNACEFRITVDSDNRTRESNEQNNTSLGSCFS